MTRKKAARPSPAVAAPEASAAAPRSNEERAPAVMWNGKPVYRCSRCAYERVDNLAAVLAHEKGHQTQPQVRASRIVGTDGEPLLIAEGDEQ